MSAASPPRSHNAAPLARHFVQPRVTTSTHSFAFAVPRLVILCSRRRRSPLCGRSKALAVHADPGDTRPARGLNTMSSVDDACSHPIVVGGHDMATQQHEHALASSNLSMARTSAETQTLPDLAEERALGLSAPPLVSAVMAESQRVRANFFCPGHKQGVGAEQHLRRCVGEPALRHDVPELPALDNLFSPTGVIADAQRLATDAFVGNGATDMGWSTFFLVNGSTCGIEAAVLATVRPGRKIVLPRNVHQSAIHALVLSGATPVWLEPQYDSERDLLHGIRPASVAIALAEHHGQVDAVLLVSPTYHGVCTDISAVTMVTRAAGVPLIVDEAHGAHFRFHEQLPKPAVLCGADIVIQSTHKTMGAMTQAAMMHVLESELVFRPRVISALQLVQTTSPSYLLLCSLDSARHYMLTSGHLVIRRAIQLAEQASARISGIPGFAVLDGGAHDAIYDLDPTRLTVLLPADLSGYDLDTYLIDSFGVYAELPSFRHLTFIITPGNTQADVDRLVTSLSLFVGTAQSSSTTPPYIPLTHVPAFGVARGVTPREAFFAPSETVPVRDAVGRLSADTVCPYPPGIPVLIPGEQITGPCIDLLQSVLAAGGSVSGAADISLESMRVLCE